MLLYYQVPNVFTEEYIKECEELANRFLKELTISFSDPESIKESKDGIIHIGGKVGVDIKVSDITPQKIQSVIDKINKSDGEEKKDMTRKIITGLLVVLISGTIVFSFGQIFKLGAVISLIAGSIMSLIMGATFIQAMREYSKSYLEQLRNQIHTAITNLKDLLDAKDKIKKGAVHDDDDIYDIYDMTKLDNKIVKKIVKNTRGRNIVEAFESIKDTDINKAINQLKKCEDIVDKAIKAKNNKE